MSSFAISETAGRVEVEPSGGDDWPGLFAIATAEAIGKRRTIWLLPGTFIAGTTVRFPRGTRIEASGPGVHIHSTIASRGWNAPSPYEGPFCFTFDTIAPFAGSFRTAPVIGTTVFACTNAPPIGSTLVVSSTGGGPTEPYEVIDVGPVYQVGGLDTYDVTVDHQIGFAWGAGLLSSYSVTSPQNDIVLIGNGATIDGTGERCFSIPNAVDSVVRGWDIDATEFDEYTNSLDTGSMRSVFERLLVRNATWAAGYVEYGYDCHIRHCQAIKCLRGFGAWGRKVTISDCTATGVSTSNAYQITKYGQTANFVTYNYEIGSIVRLDKGATEDVLLTDCYGAFAQYGVVVYGSRNCTIQRLNLADHYQSIRTEFSAAPENAAPVNLRVIDVRVKRTVHSGIYLTTGDVKLIRVDVDGTGDYALFVPPTATVGVFGGRYTATAMPTAIYVTGALTLDDGVLLDCSSRVDLASQLINGTGTVRANSVKFAGTATGLNIIGIVTGASLTTGKLEVVSGKIGCAVDITTVTGWWTREQPIVMSGFLQLYAGNGKKNFGRCNLTGVVPVVLNVPPTTNECGLFPVRHTLVGPPGNISWVIASLSSYNLVSDTAETSIVDWVVL